MVFVEFVLMAPTMSRKKNHMVALKNHKVTIFSAIGEKKCFRNICCRSMLSIQHR